MFPPFELANTENNTIMTTNIYQQIGLLNNPLFANVTINLSSSNGTFIAGEMIYSITGNDPLSAKVLSKYQYQF